jgi:hypothetical protein
MAGVNAYKQIWTFSSSNAGTWSEVFYKQAATLDQARTISAAHMRKRLAMLSSVCYLEKIRTAEITNLRNAETDAWGRVGAWTTGAPLVDTASCVVNLISSLIPSTRKWWMRGINDDFITRDTLNGRERLRPLAQTALQDFLDSLESNQYLILPKVNQVAAGHANNPLVQVDGSLNVGKSTITLKNPAAAVAGDIIIIARASKKDLPGLNGRWKILASAGFTMDIDYATPNFAVVKATTGYVNQYVPVVGAIISGARSSFGYYGDHQTKNVLTGSRGAKSAARVRHSA